MRITLVCVFLFGTLLHASVAVNLEVEVQNKEVSSMNRLKRQAPPNFEAGNQFIDDIFNIPISTLTAVSNLIKSTRPVVQGVRRRAQEQYDQYQANRRRTTVEYIDLRRTSPRPPPNRRSSHAASVAGVYNPRRDGSAYRI